MSNNNPFDKIEGKRFSQPPPTSFDDLLKESNSNVSVTASKKRNSFVKWGTIVTVALIILAFAGYALSRPVQIQEVYETPESVTQSSQSSSETVAPAPSLSNPMKEASSDFPVVEPGLVSVSVDKNTLSATGANSLLVFADSVTVQGSSAPCEVNQTDDFCLAATGKIGEEPITVFFLKDAVRSRIFENSVDFKELKIPNASISASMKNGVDKDSASLLVLGNKDGSGWLLRFSPNLKVETVTPLVEVIQ